MYTLFKNLPPEIKQEIIKHLDDGSYLCLRIALCQCNYENTQNYHLAWKDLALAVEMIPRFVRVQLIQPNLKNTNRVIKVETPFYYNIPVDPTTGFYQWRAYAKILSNDPYRTKFIHNLTVSYKNIQVVNLMHLEIKASLILDLVDQNDFAQIDWYARKAYYEAHNYKVI